MFIVLSKIFFNTFYLIYLSYFGIYSFWNSLEIH